MAVFDRKIVQKVSLDDTEALTITIENAQNVNGHTEYVIRVQRGPLPEKSWLICKRYSDFVALHNSIQGSEMGLTLPPKKLIGNMDRTFIAQRQFELQNYLNLLLMNPFLALSLEVRKFLDPKNYSVSLQEIALQHVSMILRSEIDYELIKLIIEMGWRLRKHYFLVKSKLKPKTELLLQWVEFGPDKYLEDKEIQKVLKCLKTLNHPNIETIEYIHCSEGGCFTIRQLYPYGTLRDLIYGTKPKMSFLKKYGNSKNSKALNFSDISLYGKQILETLIFLHEKKIPFGHLHTGNILVVDNCVKLIDIENTILGLPSFYRPFFVQHRKINTLEAIDVYCFGHVLFEMTFGYPLKDSVCDNIPDSCPLLGVILESILTTESCKAGLPSLQELLQHNFFSVSAKQESQKINFKISSDLKISIKGTVSSTEKRLQDEQKVIRHQKKVIKMQEYLVSNEDMLITKQKLKEDNSSHKQIKINIKPSERSPRSNSLTSNSTSASIGTVTPPLQAPKISSVSNNSSPAADGRSALLDSICSFDKSVLRHRPTENGSTFR